MLLVTGVSTTWAVVIFRVKWRVVVTWRYLCLWSWFGLVSFVAMWLVVETWECYNKMVVKLLWSLLLRTINNYNLFHDKFHSFIRSQFLYVLDPISLSHAKNAKNAKNKKQKNRHRILGMKRWTPPQPPTPATAHTRMSLGGAVRCGAVRWTRPFGQIASVLVLEYAHVRYKLVL